MIAIKYHSTVKSVKSIIWIISSSEEGMEENWSKSNYDVVSSSRRIAHNTHHHHPCFYYLSVLCTTTKPTMMAKLLVLS